MNCNRFSEEEPPMISKPNRFAPALNATPGQFDTRPPLVCCSMLTSSLNRVLAASLPWLCIVNEFSTAVHSAESVRYCFRSQDWLTLSFREQMSEAPEWA
jgi:hypothetical protein